MAASQHRLITCVSRILNASEVLNVFLVIGISIVGTIIESASAGPFLAESANPRKYRQWQLWVVSELSGRMPERQLRVSSSRSESLP
jgi:hypothetical protein